MSKNFLYKVFDYANIEHHNNLDVEKYINKEFADNGFELITVLDMGENNSNKDGKSSRFRYIFKKRAKL